MSFRVGLTRDLIKADGEPSFGRGPLDILNAAGGVQWEVIAETLAA